MKQTLVILALVTTAPAARAADDIADTIRAFGAGRPAALAPEALASEARAVRAVSEAFASELEKRAQPDSPKCQRFNALAVRAARDIARTLNDFRGPALDVNDPNAVYAHARLQVALPTFAQLKSFVDEDREGGYGFLDRRQKNACAYDDRAAVKAAFRRTADAYLAFQRAALGEPGLDGLETLTERLLTLALRDEVKSQRVGVAVTGVIFVVGYFAQTAATNLVGLGIRQSGLLNIPLAAAALKSWPVRYAGRVAYLVADGMVSNAFSNWVNPAEAQRTSDTSRPQFDFGSWGEKIADFEKFFASGLAEPQLYLAYVSTLEADFATLAARWLGERATDVQAASAHDPALDRQVQNVLWLAGESAFLRGQIPTVASRQLPEFIFAKFNVRVTCGLGQPLGPSPLQCLIGERRVARALYSGALHAPSSEVAGLTSINVTTKKAYAVVPLESSVRIDLPYKRPSVQTAEYVNAAYGSRQVLAKLKLQNQFERTFAAWTKANPVPVEFDPDVGLSAQWNALANLSEIQRREPELLARPGAALYLVKPILTSGYRTVFERHLKLQESLPANASYDQMVNFLRVARQGKYVEPARAKVAALQAEIATVAASITSKWSVEARCSDAGAMRLARCLGTLKRLDRFATDFPNVRVDAQQLLVTGVGEPGDNFEKMQNPDDPAQAIWMIRDNFRVNDLADFLKTAGWIED